MPGQGVRWSWDTAPGGCQAQKHRTPSTAAGKGPLQGVSPRDDGQQTHPERGYSKGNPVFAGGRLFGKSDFKRLL